MKYRFYSDESGTSAGPVCYTIGAILVPESHRESFPEFVRARKAHYKIDYELKWERVRTSYGLMNCAIDILRYILAEPLAFTSIVVKKATYRKWREDEDTAFYTSYTLLLTSIASMLSTTVAASIDAKSTEYDKHHEVVEKIAKYKLRRTDGDIDQVIEVDSKDCLEIQAADLLTGAINASHNLFLNPSAGVHAGKKVLIERLARTVGWDALHYDTMPNPALNIWHFPQTGFRGVPATKRVGPDLAVPYISRAETTGG